MADVVKEAVQAVEESGIVFIDEIDKVSAHCYTHTAVETAALIAAHADQLLLAGLFQSQ
jgi:ATP-dependent protease HslVU (ClpYQ) ATPase subunit